MTKVDDIFAKADAKSKVSSTKVQNSSAEFEANNIKSKISNIKFIYYLLKCKVEIKEQKSKSRCRNLNQYYYI